MKIVTFFLGCILAGLIEGPAPVLAVPLPSFSISDVTADENLGQACFTIKKHGKLNSLPSTVTFYTGVIGDTAKAGEDYTAQTTNIDFPATGGTKTACVGLINDTIPEPTKKFTGKIKVVSNARLYDGTGIATLTDSDVAVPVPPPMPPTFTPRDLTVNENAGTVQVIVDKANDNGLPSVVSYSINPGHGTAMPGGDFVAASGSFTVAAGQMQFGIPVTIINDAINELDENFIVTLTGDSNGAVSRSAVVTIHDDDPVTPVPPPLVSPKPGDPVHTATACRAWGEGSFRNPLAGEKFTVVVWAEGVSVDVPLTNPMIMRPLAAVQSVVVGDTLYLYQDCLVAG
jgi:hypothetical protein